MAIFGDFFASYVSASRVQHVSDLHPKFALRPHHVLAYIQYATVEIRRGKEQRKQKKKPQDENMMVCPIP